MKAECQNEPVRSWYHRADVAARRSAATGAQPGAAPAAAARPLRGGAARARTLAHAVRNARAATAKCCSTSCARSAPDFLPRRPAAAAAAGSAASLRARARRGRLGFQARVLPTKAREVMRMWRPWVVARRAVTHASTVPCQWPRANTDAEQGPKHWPRGCTRRQDDVPLCCASQMRGMQAGPPWQDARPLLCSPVQNSMPVAGGPGLPPSRRSRP